LNSHLDDDVTDSEYIASETGSEDDSAACSEENDLVTESSIEGRESEIELSSDSGADPLSADPWAALRQLIGLYDSLTIFILFP
jgi:hypothetical protein